MNYVLGQQPPPPPILRDYHYLFKQRRNLPARIDQHLGAVCVRGRENAPGEQGPSWEYDPPWINQHGSGLPRRPEGTKRHRKNRWDDQYTLEDSCPHTGDTGFLTLGHHTMLDPER